MKLKRFIATIAAVSALATTATVCASAENTSDSTLWNEIANDVTCIVEDATNDINDNTSSSKSTEVQASFRDMTFYYTVKNGTWWLRQGPNMNTKKLAVIHGGPRVYDAYLSFCGWYPLCDPVSGKDGWIGPKAIGSMYISYERKDIWC